MDLDLNKPRNHPLLRSWQLDNFAKEAVTLKAHLHASITTPVSEMDPSPMGLPELFKPGPFHHLPFPRIKTSPDHRFPCLRHCQVFV
ncbi:MAG: hypothetical protein RLZ97_908 [Verrucomicrobiota bacterium]